MFYKTTQKNNEEILKKTTNKSIFLNIFLGIIKVLTGIFGKSSAMISDGVHTFSDVFSTLIVIFGFKISNKEADENHIYGHERFESVSSIILSIVLLITGIFIGYDGIKVIWKHEYSDLPIPSYINLLVALLSIILKELMFRQTRNSAIKINSPSLEADAWHHRSDALSSIGSLIGVMGARLSYPIFDPLASLIICIFIVKAAYDIFVESIRRVVDESYDKETVENIKKAILKQKGVIAVDDIKTRKFGTRAYVDVEISVEANLSLIAAHDIAEKVHEHIETTFPFVKHCMVHVNPYEKD